MKNKAEKKDPTKNKLSHGYGNIPLFDPKEVEEKLDSWNDCTKPKEFYELITFFRYIIKEYISRKN